MLSGKKGYLITATIVLVAVFGIIEFGNREARVGEGEGVRGQVMDPALVVPVESKSLSGSYEVQVVTSEAESESVGRALQLAAETINSGNGVGGKKLVFDKVIAEGDAVAVALSSGTAKFAIVSETGSDIAAAAADAGKIALSISGAGDGNSSSDALYDLGSGTDPVGAAAAAGRYAVVDLEGKRIAAISGPDAASVAVRRSFGEAVRRAGGFLVDDEIGTVATGSGLASVKASNPDVLFVYASDAALRKVLADEAARESRVKILTADLPASATDESRAETMPAGTLAFVPEFDASEERVSDFVHVYKVRFGAAPEDVGEAAVANALPFLIRDLAEKDSNDVAKMRTTLETLIAGWSGGAIGSLSIDRNGDAVWDRYAVWDVGSAAPSRIGTVSE